MPDPCKQCDWIGSAHDLPAHVAECHIDRYAKCPRCGDGMPTHKPTTQDDPYAVRLCFDCALCESDDPITLASNEVAALRERITALTVDLGLADKEIERRHATYRDEVAALRAENESLRKRDSELWADAQRKIDTFKERLAALRAEVRHGERAFDQQKQCAERLEAELAEVKACERARFRRIVEGERWEHPEDSPTARAIDSLIDEILAAIDGGDDA